MLEMKNVTKTFGNFKALDDLTLTVPSGRVYGLVGPNGAGKSTAIRHLTGVYRPDSGSVTMDGQPIYENPAVKAAIGYIPDEIFYYPSATLDVMFGRFAPVGKLPLTLPKGDEVLAVNADGVCISPNDVPGFAKDAYMPDSMKDENGKAYAYRDAAGNYYEMNFGLTF